ncbi:unnamed protein product, partial [Coregonus sp. 'balchen']
TSLPLALVDSGDVGNLLDSALATALRIPLVPLQSPIPNTPTHPVVLDLTWLSWHNHVISWSERRMLGWSQECQGRCLAVSVNTT